MDNFLANKQPKPTKSKRVVVLSLIGVLLIGGVIYYTWPKSVSESNTPPSLDISGDGLQGLLRTSQIWLELEEDDKPTSCTNEYDIPIVANYTPFYWFTEDTYWEDFISSINGAAGTYILTAYYSPEEGYHYSDPGYYAFPGPSETMDVGTTDAPLSLIPVVEDIDDLGGSNSEIEAYRPFLIVTLSDIEVCGFEDKMKTITDPAEELNVLGNNYEGWVMLQAPEDTDDLASWFDDYDDRIDSFFTYSYDPGEECPCSSDSDSCSTDYDGDDYQDECWLAGDIDDPGYTSDNYTIWVEFAEGESVS